MGKTPCSKGFAYGETLVKGLPKGLPNGLPIRMNQECLGALLKMIFVEFGYGNQTERDERRKSAKQEIRLSEGPQGKRIGSPLGRRLGRRLGRPADRVSPFCFPLYEGVPAIYGETVRHYDGLPTNRIIE